MKALFCLVHDVMVLWGFWMFKIQIFGSRPHEDLGHSAHLLPWAASDSTKKWLLKNVSWLIWLVVDLPRWKIWLRQLGVWHSQYMENTKCSKPPTSWCLVWCFRPQNNYIMWLGHKKCSSKWLPMTHVGNMDTLIASNSSLHSPINMFVF